MLWQSSYSIWSFLCLLTLHQIPAASGIICDPGEKATSDRNRCERCPEDQYNPAKTESKECHNCDPCVSNSKQISPCTRKSNTKCQCLKGFEPVDNTQQRCYCQKGSGIKFAGKNVICEKCPPKTSTIDINLNYSECQLQPQYVRISVTIPGNVTTYVNSGNEAKTDVPPALPLSQTSTSTLTMTSTTSRNSISTPATSIPVPQDSTKHALWLASLAGIVLFILIMKISRCPKKKTDIVRQGSACGKPVEESGEKFLPPCSSHAFV
ncbi:uncharacterized protein Hap1MRO34_008351 [Clarias gariepinus]|uniref:tumor necrosis factor receptor superfamily member 3 n=1 Tax=Clarias gariepinus TaxID=13013 RepID=UPI00234CAE09|nr:tumor necrosis factor receptor superfamily member 3 [Clarias gariepinus]